VAPTQCPIWAPPAPCPFHQCSCAPCSLFTASHAYRPSIQMSPLSHNDRPTHQPTCSPVHTSTDAQHCFQLASSEPPQSPASLPWADFSTSYSSTSLAPCKFTYSSVSHAGLSQSHSHASHSGNPASRAPSHPAWPIIDEQLFLINKNVKRN
jgi:hypothetical protein